MPFLTLPAFVMDEISPRADRGGAKFQVRGATLVEVFNNLRDSSPRAVERIFSEDGMVRKNVIVVVNDELVARDEAANLTFTESDELALIMQFAGG